MTGARHVGPARRNLRGTQLVLAWTFAGVLLVAGSSLWNVGSIEVDGVGLTSAAHVWPGTALLVLGLAVALAGPSTVLLTSVGSPRRGVAPAERALHAASEPVGS